MIAQVRRVLRSFACIAALCGASIGEAQAGPTPVRRVEAPTSVRDVHWKLSGDIGGVLGGHWLEGTTSPMVSSGAGVALSLGLHRAASRRLDAGGTIRVLAQPLHLQERETRWDGGTLTETQALATMAIVLGRIGTMQTRFDVGAGFAVLSGAQTLYPFSAASRVTSATEAGISLRRGAAPGARPLALFARYGVVRIDPGPTQGSAVDAMTATAGWVGRTTVGVRVER